MKKLVIFIVGLVTISSAYTCNAAQYSRSLTAVAVAIRTLPVCQKKYCVNRHEQSHGALSPNSSAGVAPQTQGVAKLLPQLCARPDNFGNLTHTGTCALLLVA